MRPIYPEEYPNFVSTTFMLSSMRSLPLTSFKTVLNKFTSLLFIATNNVILIVNSDNQALF